MSYYDEEKTYVIVVHKGRRKGYVDHVDFSTNTVHYTNEPWEAGSFYPYERAVKIASIIKEIESVTKVKVYDREDDDWII